MSIYDVFSGGNRPFDKEEWAAAKQAQRKEAYELIDNTCSEMMASGDSFRQYLNVQGRFDRYSVANAILVSAQMPEAMQLKEYSKWKANRVYVNKDAQKIIILEPSKEYTREDGTKGISYNAKVVYDISETSAKDRQQEQEPKSMRELVSALIDASPVPCVPVGELELPAYYDSSQQTIFVKKGLSEEVLFVSMAKEVSAAVYDFKYNESRDASDFKSFCVAYMVSSRYGVDTKGFDFSRLPSEYAEMDISATSENHINAMDMNSDYGDGANPVILKSEFILSLCEQLIGGTNLGAKQKSIIDRCTASVYRYYQQGNYMGTPPTLQDFREELLKQNEPEAQEIALAIELFTDGSLNTFAKHTNVDTHSRLICYDILDLGKQLQPIGMLVVLDSILNRIPEYVELIKAVMMQESGGRGLDPMQAAEGSFNTRYPHEPNGIKDPEYSIECGVQELKAALISAEVENPIDMEHIKLALQGYNFGNGYISWAKTNYGGYSYANAVEFSTMQAARLGWDSYGDTQYPAHVLRYYPYGRAFTSGGNQAIVEVALTQLGNEGGQTYWSWYGFDGRVEWCACFVSWCADQCGYIESGIIPKFAGCVDGANWFKGNGQWKDRSYEPSAGDIIFFDWEGDGETDHVGIVEKCENGVVYTVEGNSGDACRQNQYTVGSSSIYGYGVPAY